MVNFIFTKSLGIFYQIFFFLIVGLPDDFINSLEKVKIIDRLTTKMLVHVLLLFIDDLATPLCSSIASSFPGKCFSAMEFDHN